MSHKKLRQGIIETCIEMNRSGLNQGTSGNVSHRVEGGMLVTPTSLAYERMKNDDIVEMAFDGTYDGKHRPSSEWRFHRDILKNRQDVNVVLHTHSVYCTTLATHERGIPAFHYMVAVAGGSDIRCSPYACFGTQELSNYALEALKDRTACLLGHHGLIVVADTFETALWRATEIETLAKMYVHALAIGEPPRLNDKEMAQVIEQMRRMSYGQAPDLDKVKDAPKPLSVKAAETVIAAPVVTETKPTKAPAEPKTSAKAKAPAKADAPAKVKVPAQAKAAVKPATVKAAPAAVDSAPAAPKTAKAPTRKAPSRKAPARKAKTAKPKAPRTAAAKAKATASKKPAAAKSTAPKSPAPAVGSASFKSLVGAALSRRK
jgi:L-fuculose-phosphate aldolase